MLGLLITEVTILRIRRLSESVTYKFPEESIVIATGQLKVALVPVPLENPGELPAIVETTPEDVILRIRRLPVSATYIVPD